MVGLGGLEPPTCPYQSRRLGFTQLQDRGDCQNYAEVVQDIAVCGLDCGCKSPGFCGIHIVISVSSFIRKII